MPVPEIYGWCRDGEETFKYMELVRRSTLEQRWDELSTPERSSICDQLHPMIAALRTLTQSPRACVGKFNSFGHVWDACLQLKIASIRNIGYGQLPDVIFQGSTPPGPFSHVSTFQDWFSRPSWANESNQPFEINPMRQGLPDDPINFVHGDLHRSNILVTWTEKGPARVIVIIGWHQSGWYPAYWEYCEAGWTAEVGDEWVTSYISKIMQPRIEVYDFWNYFVLCRGM